MKCYDILNFYGIKIKMNNSDLLRQNINRIQRSQAQFLEELKNQHKMLSGYMKDDTVNTYHKYGGPQKYNSASGKKESALYNEDHIGDVGNYQHYLHTDFSLDLSKSEGNDPTPEKKVYLPSYGSTNTDTILQNNYKKIQELLIKQRNMQEQNHALQQENQSLLADFREIKKLYYQLKQMEKSNQEVVNFVFMDIIYEIIKDLLLNLSNSQIITHSKKKMMRFKVLHPSLFQDKNKNYEHHAIGSDADRLLEKVYDLLEQDYNVPRIQEKQREQQQHKIIQDLKNQIQQLSDNRQLDRKNQQITSMNMQLQKMMEGLKKQNNGLYDRIRELQKKQIEQEGEQSKKRKQLQGQIIKITSQLRVVQDFSKDREKGLENNKNLANKYRMLAENNAERYEQIKEKLSSALEKLHEKENLYVSQVQLTKRQNLTISQLSNENTDLRGQIQRIKEQNVKNRQNLVIDKENVTKDLKILNQQFSIYRMQSDKQIKSLQNHLDQIKKQYDNALKSQQQARVNEMKYRQLVLMKKNMAKLTTNIDHLWQVKQIQYGNVMKVLQGMY